MFCLQLINPAQIFLSTQVDALPHPLSTELTLDLQVLLEIDEPIQTKY